MLSMRYFFNFLFRWIRDGFDVLRRCWLVLFMLAVAWFALVINDQGRDVLTGFNDFPSAARHHPFTKYLLMSVLLFGWSFYTWFSSRIALHLSSFPLDLQKDPQQGKRIRFLQRWIPRLLGVAAYGVVLVAYLKYVSFYRLDLIFILPLLLYFLYVVRRRYIFNRSALMERMNLAETTVISQRAIRISELSRMAKVTFGILIFIFIVVVALIIIFRERLKIDTSPVVVILLALTLWTGLITALIAVEKGFRFPAVLVVCLIAVLFSYFNNNHAVRTVSLVPFPARPELKAHFGEWLRNYHDKRRPVILVSGEGGGIRAGYWMAGFLAQLHDSLPEADRCIYALSTVSGSSLGAAVYTALRSMPADTGKGNYFDRTDRFFHYDFLSPVTAAFLFPDLVQRYLPFPVPVWDRARYLEYAWEYDWQLVSGQRGEANTMKKPLTEIWKKPGLPLVFFNSTKAENGERAVASFARLPVAEVKNDLLQIMRKDIPLSTAALISARFPFITPGGEIFDAWNKKWGTVVDGGYYDNSGTVTLQDIYQEIRPVLKAATGYNQRIIVLVVQNGNHEDDTTTVLHGLYEMKTVMDAFYNAWSERPNKQVEEFGIALKANQDTLIKVSLIRNKNINLPLGWYLSDSAREKISDQLKQEPVQQVICRLRTLMQ